MNNFLPTFMQVFQNYNEFGKVSSSYIKGKNYIAYLINEFEIIYWLRLENIWKRLNVVFESEGKFEDERNYGNVYLRQIHGDIIYKDVPNIPDPERITSMKDFLKEYPDIENLYFTDTINLTTLENAFANSNLRTMDNFNTENVNNFNKTFSNLLSTNLNIKLTTNKNYIDITNILDKSTIDTFILNMPNIISFNEDDTKQSINIGDNIIANKVIFNCGENYNGLYINLTCNNKIEYLKIYNAHCNINKQSKYSYKTIDAKNIDFIHSYDSSNEYFMELAGESYFINADTITTKNNNISKYGICKIYNGNITLNCINLNITLLGSNYGSYININSVENINIINDDFIDYPGINAFLLEVDKVNNNVLSKYKCFFSIFQYKSYGNEIADVDIQPYDDYLINFPNVEIVDKYSTGLINDLFYNIDTFINDYSKFNTVSYKIYVPFNIGTNNSRFNSTISSPINIHFKELIIDNRDYELNINNAPIIINIGDNYNISADNGYISGTFRYGIEEKDYIINCFNSNDLFKNSIIYNCTYIDIYDKDKDYYSEKRNLKFKESYDFNDNIYYPYLQIHISGKIVTEIDIWSFINNNIFKSPIRGMVSIVGSTCYNTVFKYYNDVIINIDCKNYFYYRYSNINNYLNLFRNYIIYPNKVFINDIVIINDINAYPSLLSEIQSTLESVYINNCTIKELFTYSSNDSEFNRREIVYLTLIPIKNIYGENITLYINSYHNYDFYFQKDIYTHIDISHCEVDNNAYLTIFENFDNETLINSIDKLIDNTNNNTKTIYIYKSQQEIIGEKIISEAVTKNYEIAIIIN